MDPVFISYRRGDSEGQARALSKALEEHVGKGSVFMDVDSIALGRDFRQVLRERLDTCGLMLVLIGPNWLDAKDPEGERRLDKPDDYVRMEIAAALKRDIPLTPVLLQGASIPAQQRLPKDLKDLVFRNAFELSHARWDSDVAEMVKRLGLARSASPKASPPAVKAYGLGLLALTIFAVLGRYGFSQYQQRGGETSPPSDTATRPLAPTAPPQQTAKPTPQLPTNDGLITHSDAGLTWTTVQSAGMAWADADQYCRGLSAGRLWTLAATND